MKFKDKATGNIFEFTSEHDIKTMLAHPEYEQVKEEVKTSKKTKHTEEV